MTTRDWLGDEELSEQQEVSKRPALSSDASILSSGYPCAGVMPSKLQENQ
jgi:hypothetical protein